MIPSDEKPNASKRWTSRLQQWLEQFESHQIGLPVFELFFMGLVFAGIGIALVLPLAHWIRGVLQ